MKTFATPPRREPRREMPCALCGAMGGEAGRGQAGHGGAGRGAMLPLWNLEGFAFVRCAVCGLVQQNPQPEPASVISRYDSSYLEYEEREQFGYRDLELATLADLGFEEASRPLALSAKAAGRPPAFLDVGCATGALLAHFGDLGWACTGVEACAPAAAYGRERFGLDIRPTTLEDARLPAASFEVVHASHLIEHLNDPAAFLAESLRLLAPGGLLLLTTPNVDGFQARLSGAEWRSAINDHLYLFSKKTLSALLAAAGFDILASMSWGGWPRGRKPAFLKVPLDRAAKRLDRGDVMAFMARPSAAEMLQADKEASGA